MKKSILKDIGLSQNEAITYEGLLEHGESSPSKLSGITKVSRENTYYVLRSLEQKGLVEKDERKKKIVYRPLHPENLKMLAIQKKQEVEESARKIDELMPKLNNLFSLRASGPSVSVFKGIPEIKKLYTSILNEDPSPKEILVFNSRDDSSVLGKEFLKNYLKKQTLAGMKEKLITHSEFKLFDKAGGVKINREVRYMDTAYFDLPAEISIWNNKVSTISFKRDKIGTIIESKDLAESLRKIFNYIWDKS